MRLFMAMLATETNTFSPMPTGWAAFREGGYRQGDASRYPGDVLGRLLAEWRSLCEQDRIEVIEGTAAIAAPAGRTLRATYEGLRDEIVEQVKNALPLDIVLLGLHGAMVAQGYDDCEGDLLSRIRSVAGVNTIVGAELDLHCHATQTMFEAANVLICFKEYPHTDTIARGRDLYAICRAAALGEVKPTTGVFDCRMVSMWRTNEEPMKSFVRDMQALEGKDGVLSVSFGHGFPWGDVADVGAKVWVVTNGDQAAAENRARLLGKRIYAMRERTRPILFEIKDALERALSSSGCVVLADVADNAGGGAPSDSTFILRACLERSLRNVAIGGFWDPIAVQFCFESGVGAEIALRIGGKLGPSSGAPVDVTGIVRGLSEHHTQTGLSEDTRQFGASAWIECNGIDLLLISRRDQVISPDAFSNLGLDPFERRIVVVKSTQHFYAGFGKHASQVLYVSTPGAIAPDFSRIPYTKRDGNYWPRVPDPLVGH